MDIQDYLKGVKGIIFDYGGTIDTDGSHWSNIIYKAWKEAGVEVDFPVFREAYVYCERELARVKHILPEHDFLDMMNIKIRIELDWLARQGQFPPQDVEEKASRIAALCNKEAEESVNRNKPVLAALAAQYPMVVVSNFYGNLNSVMAAYGVRQYFKAVIESAAEGVRKPDPEIFVRGVKALGLPAEQCVVVGDSFTKDIQPALKAGCRAIQLRGAGWAGSEGYEATDYAFGIEKLSDLTKILL